MLHSYVHAPQLVASASCRALKAGRALSKYSVLRSFGSVHLPRSGARTADESLTVT